MNLFTSFGHTQSFRLPKTMKNSLTECYVRRLHANDVVIDLAPLDESMLRRRIQELQHYRRLGLTSSADIEKYENELYHRVRYTFDSSIWGSHRSC